MSMQKGDVILVKFPFTDQSQLKLRPALLLSFYEGDVIACFISSQLNKTSAVQLLLNPDGKNGLQKPSVLKTGKIATLSKVLVLARLGRLSDKDFAVAKMLVAKSLDIE